MGDLVRCSTFFVRVVFCMILTVDECGIFVAMLRVMRYLLESTLVWKQAGWWFISAFAEGFGNPESGSR